MVSQALLSLYKMNNFIFQIVTVVWTIVHWAPLSMGCSRQECWNRLPFPSPGGLSNPGIEPTSLASPALAGGFFTTSATWEAQIGYDIVSVLEWNWGGGGCVCVCVCL